MEGGSSLGSYVLFTTVRATGYSRWASMCCVYEMTVYCSHLAVLASVYLQLATSRCCKLP
jgi:hypothetical protein